MNRLPSGALTFPLSPPVPKRAHDAPREATTTPPADITPPPPPLVIVLPPNLAKDTASANPCKHLVVSKGPTHLVSFHATNLAAGDRYLLMFDLPDLPANGARPKRAYKIGTEQTYEWDTPHGRYLGNGCVLAFSSTLATLTIVTADDALLDATFFRPA